MKLGANSPKWTFKNYIESNNQKSNMQKKAVRNNITKYQSKCVFILILQMCFKNGFKQF